MFASAFSHPPTTTRSAAVIEPLEQRIAPAVITVTTTADTGPGSLRDAITTANSTPAADTIQFALTGPNTFFTISPVTPLPEILAPVTIDGYTQAGAQPNSNGPTLGSNAVIKIEIDGISLPDGSVGLSINADNSTIRGLSIVSFNDVESLATGIKIATGRQGNVIAGNFIGLDANGLLSVANDRGILLDGASRTTIGGLAPADRNVISANDVGISIQNSGSDNLIIGNLIGLAPDGDSPLGAGGNAIEIISGSFNQIGGATTTARNVISASDASGILLGLGATFTSVTGNFIGTDVTGLEERGNSTGIDIRGNDNTIASNLISGNSQAIRILGVDNFDGESVAGGILTIGGSRNTIQGNMIGLDAVGNPDNPLPNSNGILIDGGASNNLIGGLVGGDGNHIAYSDGGFDFEAFFGGNGVTVSPTSTQNSILGNSIHDNAGFGILLQGTFSQGSFPGGNNQQAAPVLNQALSTVGGTRLIGTLDAGFEKVYRVEFFVADGYDDALPDAEGKTFIGATTVSTNSEGLASFDAAVDYDASLGELITATATELVEESDFGDSSQFAAPATVQNSVSIGDAAIVEGTTGTKEIVFNVTLRHPADRDGVEVQFHTASFSFDARSATGDGLKPGPDFANPHASTSPDYSDITGSVTFNSSDPLTKTIRVTIFGDVAPEGRERFRVLLDSMTDGGIDDGEGVGTIIDDDQRTFAAGAGVGSKVRVFDSITGALIREFDAFDTRITGGIRIATGDVTGDGVEDIIASAGTTGKGRVRIFDGADTSTNPSAILDFKPFGAGYRAGVFVAAGDLDGDGLAEVIASTGSGGNAEVRAFNVGSVLGSGREPVLAAKFRAFGKVNGGVRVATGDLDGDGLAEIIATNRVGTEIRTFHGDGTEFEGALGRFHGVSKTARGGLFVSAGDLDGDGRDDLIVGAASGKGEVRTFLVDGTTPVLSRTFTPFSSLSGVRVGVADVNGDGIADILVGQGAGGGSIRAFAGNTSSELFKVDAFGKGYTGGVFVG